MILTDLHRDGTFWVFTWKPDAGEEFAACLHRFKTAFPFRQRRWDEAWKRWLVPATVANEQRLVRLFRNGQEYLTLVKSQGELFAQIELSFGPSKRHGNS
jgi:hypothetical protein